MVMLPRVAYAHTGTVQGYVRDGSNGEPLVGASVILEGTNSGSVTDIFGRYTISGVMEGGYVLIISYVGFDTQREAVTVSPDKITSFSAALLPGAVRLADLVISGTTPDQEMNTISAVDIRLRPVNTSQDVLRMVPGLFIAQHGGGGKAEQIFLRGFDIDHGTDINLSVDGMPVNMVSHAHGQGYSDLHFIIPETIEKVDFNKGPYYAQKGDFTTAGYAAFLTHNSLDRSLIKLEGGQFGTLRTVGMFNLVNKTNDNNAENWYMATEYFRSNGYFESPQNFNRLNLFTKYSRRIGDSSKLSATLSTFSSRWDMSGQIPERAVKSGLITRFGSIDDTEGGETSRTNFNIQFSQALANRDIIEHQAFVSLYDFYLVSNFTFFLNDPENGDQITQRENRKIYGYNGSYLKSISVGSTELASEFGAGFRYDDINDIRLSHTKDRKSIINDLAYGDIDQTNFYAFINESVALSPSITLQGALRYDHIVFGYQDKLATAYQSDTEDKGIFSPKVSLNYTVNPRTMFYAKAGYGFHSNDTRVVVAQRGKKILPAAKGMDIGVVWKPAPAIVAQAAAWVLDLEQEFVYIGDAGVVEPGGATFRKGVDVTLRYQVSESIFVDTDITLTQARAKNSAAGEDYIPLAPSFSSIGGFTWRSGWGLSSSIRYRFLDDRAANESKSLIAEGYKLVDVVVKFTRKNYEVSLSCENVFNEKWKEAQFETESRLKDEVSSVSEIHVTPGTPIFAKAGVSFFF